jgi:hypothetical protein
VPVAVVVPVRSLDGADDVVAHFDPGASEIILQSGNGIALARNLGARRTRADVLLHTDDDVVLVGHLAWFDHAPDAQHWWIPARWSTTSGDPYTERVCGFLNAQTMLRLHSASVGSFQAMRRSAFERVGGYDRTTPHEDLRMARLLYRAYGPPALAPIEVVILRRTVTAPENWQRFGSRPPDADGPYRVYRSQPTSAAGSRGTGRSPGVP